MAGYCAAKYKLSAEYVSRRRKWKKKKCLPLKKDNNQTIQILMKKLLSICALAALLMAGCQKPEEEVKVESVAVSPEALGMRVGDTQELTVLIAPPDAAYMTVTWSTSDASVATVDNGLVTAVASGSANITAAVGGKSATCIVTVAPTPTLAVPTPETVNLGLSVLWAQTNLGAEPTSLGECGYYFMWGCPFLPETYDEGHYEATALNMTQETSGTELDVATALLGKEWSTPTSAQLQELIDNCNWNNVTEDGRYGIRGISKINGENIFIPFAYCMDYRGLIDFAGHDYGNYWTSTPDANDNTLAHYFYLSQYGHCEVDNPMYGPGVKWTGMTIRPVKKK